MTITIEKTDQDVLQEATGMLKAVAHPLRIAVVELLQGGRSLSVSDIQKELGVEQAAASHHLSILRANGVLNQQRDGRRVMYSLRHPRLIEVVRCIKDCCVN